MQKFGFWTQVFFPFSFTTGIESEELKNSTSNFILTIVLLCMAHQACSSS